MKHAAVLLITLSVVVASVLFLTRVQVPGGNDVLLDPIQTEEPVVLDQAYCESAGGTWNACGSACRTEPDAVCVEMCVEYCECASDRECPAGLTCGDYVEGVGVCL